MYFSKEYDHLGVLIPDYILFNCQPEIKIYYDQWAVCILNCSHGTYRAASGGLNVFQAFRNAVETMMLEHPPQCSVDAEQIYRTYDGRESVYHGRCGFAEGHNGDHEPE